MKSPSPGSKPRAFATTRWSLVQSAGIVQRNSQAAQALDELFRIYWYPLYAFLRSKGYHSHDAQDLTQWDDAPTAWTRLRSWLPTVSWKQPETNSEEG
ncbi:MAG: hypothetical protein KDA87_26645 [Planctomycetales bacterium]|nr:hypothetical protein [Planctomycetales bacterium]